MSPTLAALPTAATSGPSSRTIVSSPTTTRSGWSPTTSASLRSIVPMNESSMPKMATRVATAAPIPSAVSSVRRGVRSTFPSGIRRIALRGHGSRRSTRDRPLRGDRWVVAIASTGAMRTDRQTGHAVASSGMTNPRAAPRANGAHLEAGLPHRQRQHAGEHGAQQHDDERTDGDAQHDAGDGDLDADEHRSQGELPARAPRAMPMPSLAPLGLDHAGRQVERPERCAGEDQPGEHVPELAVALDVVVEELVGGLVVFGHHGDAEPGRGRVERRLELRLDRRDVGAVAQGEHEVVHPAWPPGDLLCGGQRGEQRGEVGLGEQPAVLGVTKKYSGPMPTPTTSREWPPPRRTLAVGGRS